MDTLSEKIDWALKQPWSTEMMDCEQDRYWHAEGDVWTHTEMVCEALENRLPLLDLTEVERNALEWAAVLHDVGKPQCTTFEEGRVRSHNHSLIGAQRARRILAEINLDFDTRMLACNLIRWHQKPVNIENEEDTAYHVVFTSNLVPNHLLYELAVVDNEGRYYDQTNEAMIWLDMWKETCESLCCFKSPYLFNNPKARLVFYDKRSFMPFYVPHEEYKCDVIMISGLPGVGKSTLAREAFPGFPLIELDSVRKEMGLSLRQSGTAVQEMKERCRQYLREGTSFIHAGVNFLRSSRRG